MVSLKSEFSLIEEEQLELISGGRVCSIFDIRCLMQDGLRILADSVSFETRPPACVPKSAWNPVPPVPCP